ncbi:MAG TPA: hypothetical protein VJ965_03860 [Anaerolineales bacterium]|nr:hypothetical protein [Anaerolineales bacterium]
MESNLIPQVTQAKQNNLHALITKPNVVGVGVGFKQSKGQKLDVLSVVCLVTQKTSDLPPNGHIPYMLDEDIPTDVIQVGEITAFQSNTGRVRPAPGGISIGHYAITAGTLGVVVKDKITGDRLILSNNHVLANSNNAQEGDAIIQPGDADGGRVATDTIAHLERFEPIRFNSEPGTCSLANFYAEIGNFLAKVLGSSHRLKVVAEQDGGNHIDAALARPINDADVLDDILNIGVIDGTIPATLGMTVRKTGRTTGYTTGTINLLDATINVSYGTNRVARFDGQIVAGAMSQGGDSGSLVVDGNSNKAVGLLFAGSNSTTILNPIQDVLDTLQIEF